MLAQMTSGVRLAAAVGMAVSLALPGLGAVSGVPSQPFLVSSAGAVGGGTATVAYALPAATMRQLNLTVRDLTTGAPIRGARVSGYWFNGPIRGPLPTAVTNSAGLVVIKGPAQPVARTWRLLIEAPGYVSEPYSRAAQPGTESRTVQLRRR
jgi:hypothetical protein